MGLNRLGLPLMRAALTRRRAGVIPGYYVDSVNGDDAKAGTTPASAFKTIAALAAADAEVPKDTWLLKCGGSWRELINLPRANMTVQSYGTGDQPLLDASDAIAAVEWTKTDGRTNVYQCTVSLAYGGTTLVWLFENNIRLDRQDTADVAAVDAAAGSYCVDVEATTPITIYVHTPDSNNPATNGETYEYSARTCGINSNHENTAVTGIRARRGNNSDGAIRLGARYSTLTDLLSEECATHCFYVQPGATMTRCVAHNGGSGMIVLHDSNGDLLDYTLTDCQAYNDSYDYSASVGLLSHNGGVEATRFGTLNLVRFNTDKVTSAVSLAAFNTVHLSDCGLVASAGFSTASGVCTINGGSITIENFGGRVFNCGVNIYDEGALSLILRNLVIDCTDVGGQLLYCARAIGFDMEGCTVNGTPMAGIRFESEAVGSSLRSVGNTFDCGSGAYVYDALCVLASFESEDNDFTYNAAGFKIDNVAYPTFATYRAYYPEQDINSTPAPITQWLPSPAPTDLTVWSKDGANLTTTNFIENGQTIVHSITKAIGSVTPMPIGGLCTVYFEIKPYGRTWIKVSFPRNSTNSYFELTGIGNLGINNGVYARNIELLDNGYYGVWVAGFATSNQAANCPDLALAQSDGGGSYAGDSTSGVIVRLAQVCDGSGPLPLP